MILRHKATGDLYVEETASNFNQVNGIDGTPYSILEPVIRVKKKRTGDIVWPEKRNHDLLHGEKAEFGLTLIVTKAELAEQFEELSELYAVQNTDIDDLVTQYTHEECDFTDENILGVAAQALREVGGMGDSLSRCNHYVLANFVLRHVRAK